MYVEGWYHTHDGELRTVTFVVVENTPPYGASLVSLSDEAMMIGEAMLAKAKTIWKECLETDTWPSYQPETLSPPQWLANQWGIVLDEIRV